MIEIIAKNIDDVIAINKSNADRIEFCVELNHGGLTPKINDIKKSINVSSLPIMIMLRKHYDTFQITKQQLSNLIKILKKINKLKIQGIVFGAILANKIDKFALKKIMENLNGIEITFHKAFDYVDNFKNEAMYLKKMNVTRVLTSGGKGNPIKNKENLFIIKNTGIEVLVGGGVDEDNIDQLIQLGFTNIHLGTSVRKNKCWNSEINIKKINKFASKLK